MSARQSARYPVTCPDCGQVREVGYAMMRRLQRGASNVCSKCQRKTAVAAMHAASNLVLAPDHVPVKEREWTVRCPGCGTPRYVSYGYFRAVSTGRRATTCISCARTGTGTKGVRMTKHPMPQPPRALSFDLAAAVAAYLQAGGTVHRGPVADLRQPWIKRVKLQPGYGFEKIGDEFQLVPLTDSD